MKDIQASLDTDLALFGAGGDLSLRKLMPALYQLDAQGLLTPQTRIIAIAREPYTTDSFIEKVSEKLKMGSDAPSDEVFERFTARITYLQMDLADAANYTTLNQQLNERPTNRLVAYYALPASLFEIVSQHLKTSGCADANTRIVAEKPIGHDLESSSEVNDALAACFDESQIYRIDHYLGKDTVQNLIALRFANSLFGNIWDERSVSHVEITVAEEVGIEGRWGYFDKAGQLRDMVQNHMLQLLCLVAMDPPADLSAQAIRDEKVRVLKALGEVDISTDVVRGQYGAGTSGGQQVPGYLQEEGANKTSSTETFVAIKARVNNWRWSGVPFYLRTGKRLPEKLSQIVVHLKPAPHYIFDAAQAHLAGNRLVIRIQPDEGIQLQVLLKDQGLEKDRRLREGPLDFSFREEHGAARIPDAYERLLWEVLQGKQSLFVRRDEIEHAWRWCDRLNEAWADADEPPKKYAAGSWGPSAAVALISRDGFSWHDME
ncbi:glucose-6-phosphate dehydrogenase [Allohahella marinimesophila]|uniref:glucose-6-phosphate dehydrogenase n=1 Tax=Allohahella marinimesophila TaxID=1054972 RepID=UPI0031DDC1FB